MTSNATPVRQLAVAGINLLLKLEEFFPSGSSKGRPAGLIADSLRRTGMFQSVGGQKPLFLAPSSGNFWRGFAHHTQNDSIEVLAVSDHLSPPELRVVPETFPHVRLKVIDNPDETGSHLRARLAWIADFCRRVPRAILIDQYRDPRVPLAYEALAREIDEQADGHVGAIFVPVGTGGLLNGISRYSLTNDRRWRIFAVDARGSRLFWTPIGVRRQFSGFGNGSPTEFVREVSAKPYNFIVVHVDDRHSALVCHRLRRMHGILLGPSGGATIAAVERVARVRPDLIPDAGHIVAVIPDGGTNYMSTLYSSDWLMAHGLGDFIHEPVYVEEDCYA
jgi:cysteine synthase